MLGGTIDTALSLFPWFAFNGVKGEVADPMLALKGEWAIEGALGGFRTMLVAAFWRGRRGFDAVGMGAWLIIGVELSKKSSWKMLRGSAFPRRVGLAIMAVSDSGVCRPGKLR